MIVQEVKGKSTLQWRIQDFPDSGGQPQMWGRQPRIFVKFPLKLHENEKKMDREGEGSRPWCPMDPPMHDSTLNETERDIRYPKHCHNVDEYFFLPQKL